MFTKKSVHVVSVYPEEGNPFQEYFSSKSKALNFVCDQKKMYPNSKHGPVYEGTEVVTFKHCPGEPLAVDVW